MCRYFTGTVLLALVMGEAFAGQQKDLGKTIRAKFFKEKCLNTFSLGVDAPLDWIKETRDKNSCRWDCHVRYLTGGAGNGGEKPYWLNFGNTPEKLVADVRKVNSIPWLTFYLLSRSAPALGQPGPAQAAPANAKVASTMKEYFGIFKVLMQGCAKEAATPVLVHVEPDEWCHLLIAAGSDPAKVEVKVASSGMDELKGLPDNLFGFAAAFKKLRDLYAPNNVFLGCSPSGWDSGGSMTGQRMGLLMKEVAGDWDFAVFETGDRPKGMVDGKSLSYGNSVTITGNLDNHIKWISDFHAVSRLYVYVWQVSAGNTYFRTCNNTPGHYCDNLAQMLLEDYPKNPTISRYVKAGCIGWMFMGGQGDADTHVFDAKKDGITNPSPIPGNLGHVAEYPDDDGGYLRLRAANYYKKPCPILSKQLGKSPDTSEPTPEK